MGIKRPASGSKNFNRLTETRHAAKVPKGGLSFPSCNRLLEATVRVHLENANRRNFALVIPAHPSHAFTVERVGGAQRGTAGHSSRPR